MLSSPSHVSSPLHVGSASASSSRGSAVSRPFVILIFLFLMWVLLQATLYQFALKSNTPSLGERSGRTLRRQPEEEDHGDLQNAAALLVNISSAQSTSPEPTTAVQPLPTVVAPAPPAPAYDEEEWFQMEWSYLADEKDWPYTGNDEWMSQFQKHSRPYWNSRAAFANWNESRMHGLLGIYSNGTRAWKPKPMPVPADQYPGGKAKALENGGFYMDLSDALPLDRDPADGRDAVCLEQKYDYADLPEASVIITFYNEALSTLFRSVHSVLNFTPPSLLREIILVDDHSNLTDNMPGSFMYDYVRLLPKVKIMRLPERRGLVWARLAGAKLASAPVLVVLDSHIEVNKGWLEPQLLRLRESPKSIVFPQILAIDSTDFSYLNFNGIGCFLSFKWVMQEKASLTGVVTKPDAIASPSMAGGLFAVMKDWFWELGGYDEEFCMWGAENVEMGFRVWMCGGRLECTPCARVYHIYRKGGHAYKSPPQCLWKNRLRTARLWTDEFYEFAQQLTHHPGFDIGPLDKILEMKERLQCKDFKWFLANVHPSLELQDMSQIKVMGEFRNKGHPHQCLDTLAHSKEGEAWGYFGCHGSGGTQGFIYIEGTAQLRSFLDESKCLGIEMKLTNCKNPNQDANFSLPGDGSVRWKAGTDQEQCLSMEKKDAKVEVKLVAPCDVSNNDHLWQYQHWQRDPNFKLPDFSPEYKAKRAAKLATPAIAA